VLGIYEYGNQRFDPVKGINCLSNYQLLMGEFN
jgi:hypothetical protein